MATYYCSAAGDDTTGTSWATAKKTFAGVVPLATASGDIIKVDKDHTEEITVDTTYTFLANVSVICVDKDASDALATMGTAGWIGNSTADRSITLAGAFKIFIYGLTFRIAGTGNSSFICSGTDGAHHELESCYIWLGTTSSSARIYAGTGLTNCYAKCKNCTLRFGNTTQRIVPRGLFELEGCTISADGSAPTTLVENPGTSRGGQIKFDGCDLSHLGSGTLIGDQTANTMMVTFSNCKLGSGFVALATQTNLNKSSAMVWLFNCAVGDEHFHMAYYDSFGSLVIDSGIYFTSGAAGKSWKITTTANCSFYTPFVSPWIEKYNSTLSAISPYVEILRDGSATAYQNDEIWGEFSYQGTAGFPLATFLNDRMTLLGTPADQTAGAGLASWTGEAGSAWSGKVESGSITPAEVGPLRARIVVGEPSITVYTDPQIRT